MKKICSRCGKVKDLLSWETMCFQCCKENELERIVEEIRSGNDDVDTSSSDYIICPYCGEAYEPAFDDSMPESYEEGTHDFLCDGCGNHFCLETTVSYSYETHKKSNKGATGQ